MKCLICGSKDFVCIHKGTRDIPELNVMKCSHCGMVQLDELKYNNEQNYKKGGMLQKSYSITEDSTLDVVPWDTWVKDTAWDDERRYSSLKELCTGKRILEFGCGNGGFLRRINNVATSVTGVELMEEARVKLDKEGINTYEALTETDEKYDVICMFHVIEHLNNPDDILKLIYSALDKDGIFVCETCNIDCVLSSYYSCQAYEDFTYWSEHVILFNSDTLERLITRNGFVTQLNTQIERYSIANHLFWLAHGKPGGHVKWTEFNEKELNNAYAKKLIQLGIADTLWYIGRKFN